MKNRRLTLPRALLPLLMAATACGNEPTSVRLEIVAAPTLSLDGLAITVDGTRRVEPMADTLQFLVPDRWGGTTQRIAVEGMIGDAIAAVGEVDVMPIAGTEITARVALIDPACPRTCSIGATRCRGDAVETCEFSADGCPSWSEPLACAPQQPFCSAGTCSTGCSDECTIGATRCDDGGTVRTCGQFDSDPCIEYGPAVGCPGGETCADDACMPAYELTVVRAGSGGGSVASTPSGIACGGSCVAAFAAGTIVTLTATPSAGAAFTGWAGGGCSGVGTCTITISEPVEVTATFASAYVQVEAGSYQTCAVKSDGRVVCWGFNGDGQATPPAGSFSMVSSGSFHTCGVKTTGEVACWGRNSDGQASPPADSFVSVSAGDHTCGVKTTGQVACWGRNGHGQATAPAGSFVTVSAGASHSCGVKTDATVVCWGLNVDGQSSAPAGTFTDVSAGFRHTCGLRTTGIVECWGDDDDGQASPPADSFASLSSGDFHTCGVKLTGDVACWGQDVEGQASALAGAFTAVSSGFLHTCAVRPNGIVECWGDNADGQSTPP